MSTGIPDFIGFLTKEGDAVVVTQVGFWGHMHEGVVTKCYGSGNSKRRGFDVQHISMGMTIVEYFPYYAVVNISPTKGRWRQVALRGIGKE